MHLRQGGCPGAQPPSRQIAPTQASRTHYTGNSLASPAWVCRTDGLTSLPSPSSCKTLREQEIRSLKEMRSVTMRLSTPPAEPPPRRTWVQGGRRVLSGESWLWHWPGRRQSSWIRLRHSWWHVYLQSARGEEKRESQAPETHSLPGTPGRDQTPAGGQTDARGHGHGQNCQPGTCPHRGTFLQMGRGTRIPRPEKKLLLCPLPRETCVSCCSAAARAELLPFLRPAGTLIYKVKNMLKTHQNHGVHRSPAMLLGDVTCTAPAAQAWPLHEERILRLPTSGGKKHFCVRQKSNYLRSLNRNASRASD